jgi:hypothetical protein
MCSELSSKLECICLVLDEKNCDNLKQTISHLYSRLREQLIRILGNKFQEGREGVVEAETGEQEKTESGDEVNLQISQLADSGDD